MVDVLAKLHDVYFYKTSTFPQQPLNSKQVHGIFEEQYFIQNNGNLWLGSCTGT